MVQFRRLDPLANAGPYQRLQKSPVKSFTLTEAQYERVKERRPELLVEHGESAVIGLPQRDLLTIHYGYPEVEAFRDNFQAMFTDVVEASSRAEAPRGVLLSFRDRPNRNVANTIFWALFLEEGAQWVEMNLQAPEQPEPEDAIADGYRVREASESDRDAIRDIEAEATGRERLSDAGLTSIYEEASWLRLVEDSEGRPTAYLAMHNEPGGWGIIDELRIRPAALEALRRPALQWAIAFLRNHGGRRIRHQLYMDDNAGLTLLRELGFTPGETGLDYTRPVDQSEVRTMIEDRQSHGTLIKFGDWR